MQVALVLLCWFMKTYNFNVNSISMLLLSEFKICEVKLFVRLYADIIHIFEYGNTYVHMVSLEL